MSKTEDDDESERKLKMLEEILNRIQKLREEILKKKYESSASKPVNICLRLLVFTSCST